MCKEIIIRQALKENLFHLHLSKVTKIHFRWKKELQCVKGKLEGNVSEYLIDFLKAWDIKTYKELKN